MSSFNSIGITFIFLMGILIIILPRRLAVLPILMTCCYITLGQVVVIASLHFTAMRIIILFYWIRILLRREFLNIKLNNIDKLLILWTVVRLITYVMLWQTTEALINQLGVAYNVIGLYFMFRCLIYDFDDMQQMIKTLAIILIPLTILMLNEYTTGRNLFSIFGGVDEFTAMRDGKVRCQGPFAHPILAGSFGATIMPLFIFAWYKNTKNKVICIIGVLSSTIIAILSVSSGPIVAYLFGLIGLFMWPLRRQMQIVRYIILFCIISLHLIMKAPVWYLMARMADLTGGHGWYRAAVIDAAIEHISEWWAIGTQNTAHWGLTVLPEYPMKSDITNQYINIGIDGGIITMLLFILIIVVMFRHLGNALKVMQQQPHHIQILLWSMGATLFAHTMNFFSVSYFDQIIVFWYLLLAMIATASIVSAKLDVTTVTVQN